MYGWKKGWPSYIEESKSDYTAIISIAEKCAKIAGVSLDEEEGYMRIKAALATIATYCYQSALYCSLRIFNINIKLEEILTKMQAHNRASKTEKEKLHQADQSYNEAKIKRIAEEKRMRDDSKKILIAQILEWDIIWEYSYKIYKETKGAMVTGYDKAKELFEILPEEEQKEIEKVHKERINRYKEKLKNWDNELHVR